VVINVANEVKTVLGISVFFVKDAPRPVAGTN